MATYQPPKRGAEFITYVSLVSQADAKLLKANPTLAAGDVQISKDGGAFANLTTLPTVTPAAGKGVKVTLSAAEMTADNVLVIFSDAAGAEWCDLSLNVQTSALQIDDLATPTNITAGTVTTVTNLTNLPAIPANWLTEAGIAANAITAAKLAADVTTELQSGLATPTNITAGTLTTVTNLTNLPAIPANWLTAAGIAAAALNGKGDWNIGKAGYALTTAPAVPGDAMTLTAGERTALTGVIGTTAQAESYRANGATGSIAQLLYEILSHLVEASIAGTVKTTKKIDHATTATTATLNDAAAPTSITRAT